MAQTKGNTYITKEDVEEVVALFYDAKASAKILQENANGYIS
jgi:DNA helicase TIP49 (TBP-interacting protein)